ncbi:MAG: ABC transporter permease [Lachnospiraceae bacterium]|nr:ABC transporter permease [Lachnospiraceae bacterium]MBR5916479.1 ABC transporter permease [Lachnospiraceae bacterium]
MEKIKRFLSKIKYYRAVCLVISFVTLIIGIVMSIIISIGANKYQDQTVAKRWDKSGNCSHISVFIKDTAFFTKTDMDGFEYELNNKLDFNSVYAESEESRRFIDCYVAKTSITLEGPCRTMDVNCMAVGGDFFKFHPVKLLTGTYFSGNDLMQDGVILDEETAWQLFGSSDVDGQKVLFGDRVLFVKGVYKKSEGKIYNYARGEKPEIFVPFELLNSEEAPLYITTLEVCMPNPIKNFAANIMTDLIQMDSSTYEIVDNSSRYSVENLWMIYKNKKYRSMQNHDIIYPYWEKIARYEEDLLAPKAVVMVVSYVTSGTVFIGLLLYEISKLTKLKKRNDD